MQKSLKATKSFNMKFFSEDNSTNKEVSFLRLKSELMQSEKFFNDNSFTKKELISLGQYFKIKANAQQKKDGIIHVLVKGILETQHVNTPEESHMDTEQAGPSGILQISTVSTESDPGPSVQSEPVRKKSKRTSVKGKGKERKRKGKGERTEKENNR
ncbi:unnamed protein product [Mytilus edulis]|uniref:Uncharacterized protein n=1 Tax=Mytilus edulis TaxID=6550 RepID=A0A8S3T0M7_MYTED|nr:unnamed protein product [Mytilus edulis]